MNMLNLTFAASLALLVTAGSPTPPSTPIKEPHKLELGHFSVSLAVKDIKVSKAFYESLDFQQVAGNLEANWVVMASGSARIGLFQGMFEKNLMTFNPGWGADKQTLHDFQDVRELQRILKSRGLTLTTEADQSTGGPAYFTLIDPDGNPILVDQHV